MLEMSYVAWILLIILGALFVKSVSYMQKKRLHLRSYVVLLLLRDDVREDHKQKFADFVRNTEAENAMHLLSTAESAIEKLADQYALNAETSSVLRANVLVWNLKKGEITPK